MLQHAFLTPEPVHRSTPGGGQATYADLFHLAVQAVDRACETRPESLDELALEIRGFETFLQTAARHLQQVLPLAPPSPAARKLLETLLQRKRPIPVRAGAWAEAARAVAISGELLATHHTDRTAPATPEMTELYRTRNQDLALGRVFALLLAGCGGGRDLARQAITVLKQQSSGAPEAQQQPLSRARITELERLVETVSHHTQAGLWQVERAGDATSELDTLTPAAPHVAVRAEPGAFADALSAIQTLRRISYRQAHRLETASPGSLNDLAQLAALATDPDAEWIWSRNQQCETGFERVQLAHFRDQIDAAHRSWTAAPAGLTTNIRGLTKAPAGLAAAYQGIREHLADPQVAVALVVALPQLGKDARNTLTHLGAEGSLVCAGREPGALSIVWRPISPGQTRRLAAGFAAAGRASAAPATTLRDFQSRTPGQPRPTHLLAIDAPRILRSLPGHQGTS